MVKRICEFFMQIAHDAINFAGSRFCPTHVVDEAAAIKHAFMVANIVVHGALASRLICMEITFYKEARDAMFQNAKISEVVRAVVCSVACVAFSIEVDIAADVHIRFGICRPASMGIGVGIRPNCFAQSSAAGHRFAFVVIAAIEVKRKVDAVAIHIGIGVDGDEDVEIVDFHFFADFRQCAVVCISILRVVDRPRTCFDVRHDDVVVHVERSADASRIRIVLIQRAVERNAGIDERFEQCKSFQQVGI